MFSCPQQKGVIMDKMKVYLLIGAVLIIIVLAIAIKQWIQGSPSPSSLAPHSIVTNFKGNPQTSRAFTWHTKSPDAATVLQLAPGSGVASFDGKDVLTFYGTTSQIRAKDGVLRGVHKVEATDLAAGTRYTYRVGNGEKDGWSQPAEFETEAMGTKEFTFINVTDSQGITDDDFKLWGQTLGRAFETFPDAKFIIHNGDLTEDPEDESAWYSFFRHAEPWLRSSALMPVTGNHDEIDGKAEPFLSHFNLPENGEKSANPGTSYSFDYGPVHFVFLNTESKVKKQAEWLRADLAATNQPWIIVALHQGPYGGKQKKSIVEHWVPLFDEFGVDLVLQGHNHEYSRSYPLKGNQITEEGTGTVYVVTNASGRKLNKKKDDQFYHRVHLQNGKPMFAGIRIQENALAYEAYDIDGERIDGFVLRK